MTRCGSLCTADRLSFSEEQGNRPGYIFREIDPGNYVLFAHYLRKLKGVKVSIGEWMVLLEGIEKGLHESTLEGFYRLCRAVILKR